MLLERDPRSSQTSSHTAAVYVNQALKMLHHFRRKNKMLGHIGVKKRYFERDETPFPLRIQLNLQFQGH